MIMVSPSARSTLTTRFRLSHDRVITPGSYAVRPRAAIFMSSHFNTQRILGVARRTKTMKALLRATLLATIVLANAHSLGGQTITKIIDNGPDGQMIAFRVSNGCGDLSRIWAAIPAFHRPGLQGRCE